MRRAPPVATAAAPARSRGVGRGARPHRAPRHRSPMPAWGWLLSNLRARSTRKDRLTKVLVGARVAIYREQVYTVGRTAELTGVSTGTLRKWEQRYGVVVPQRSPGNYRLYDDDAVRRLSVMRTLVDAGWTAQEAAKHVAHDVSAAEAEGARPEVPCTDPRVRELVRCAV